MTLVLHLPFDESNGSEIAYDYSASGLHAVITDGRFTKGREGNSVYFPGNGRAEIVGSQPINLNGTFTVHVWYQAEIQGIYPTETYVLVKYAGTNRYLRVELKTTLHNWTHIAIVKDGTRFMTYVNAKLIDNKETPEGWGSPTGFCLLSNSPNSGSGFSYIDNFIVLNDQVLSQSDFANIISNATLEVKYLINGRDFKEFGITVSAIRGIIDRLEMKNPSSYDWPDYHGRTTNLNDIRFEPRQFEMDCWFSEIGKDATIENALEFKEELSKSGTIRIMIQLGTKPLIFEAYVKDSMPFDIEKWRDGKMFTKFTLKFTEDEPVKRILKFIKTDASGPVSITLKPSSLINVYWGDGSVMHDVFSNFNQTSQLYEPNTITHNYSSNGEYYIVMSGVIEDIDQDTFTTNAVQVWSKLS
ncbi:hypothetical protein [Dyadobacter sp. 3J3]|uniref:hypothetical protein n=1 Tax=Dyadobacter sp. 3J3 TaxID=2606600 RepID=UPI001356C62F|nr:hypothetical protein [Dyadobacter sp. 3J3]